MQLPKHSNQDGIRAPSWISDQQSNSNSKSNQKKHDRFIPQHYSTPLAVGTHNPLSSLPTAPSALTNFQNIFEQHILGEPQSSGREPIASFSNGNLLHFDDRKASNPSRPWLAGLELRDELRSFRNCKRTVRNWPARILEAPSLQDDFYLNLIDWAPRDQVVVALCTSIYLWNPGNSGSYKLCDVGLRNFATSVSYSPKTPHVAIGTVSGIVQVWDLEKKARVQSLGGHTQRVGTIAWGTNVLSTGSRDHSILQRDLRCSQHYFGRLQGHQEEVCGMKWSPDGQQLASGGNDNRLLIWSQHSLQPQLSFEDHLAAVKAVAWSPHQHGLLASGGGTVDRTIKFRNTLTGETVHSWGTGSQVCNLAFSSTLNELVSTHGYSQNEIALWDCGSQQRIASLTGHSCRVLYLALSPDGTTAVTGAGDETIRFWQIFPKSKQMLSECELEDCCPSLR